MFNTIVTFSKKIHVIKKKYVVYTKFSQNFFELLLLSCEHYLNIFSKQPVLQVFQNYF